jgi:hypothetical protein
LNLISENIPSRKLLPPKRIDSITTEVVWYPQLDSAAFIIPTTEVVWYPQLVSVALFVIR